MPPVTDYVIVSGRGESADAAAEALRARVKKGIAQGWEPIGGIAIRAAPGAEGGEVVILQAMVKP
jgi:hypothetical protein